LTPELAFYTQLFVILIADMIIGDPRRLPHPIRFIGALCTRFESVTRSELEFLPVRIQGVLTFLLVLGGAMLSLWICLRILGALSVVAATAGACIICYFCTAAGDLVKHSNTVRDYLDRGKPAQARNAVALMVGRDTEGLDESEISRACIESVAENMVDGITAPLFWALAASLLAPVSGCDYIVCAAFGFLGYKAVNTMDSMFGYKNERYIDFGRCAARVDDFCNFLPARISGFCLILAALVPGYDACMASRVFLRDRLKSGSPNSAHSEAAAAGALGVRLGGTSSYFGLTTEKPYLGDGLRVPAPNDITRTNRLVLISALAFYGAGFALHRLLVSGMI